MGHYHTVRSGDCLWSIGERNHIPWKKIWQQEGGPPQLKHHVLFTGNLTGLHTYYKEIFRNQQNKSSTNSKSFKVSFNRSIESINNLHARVENVVTAEQVQTEYLDQSAEKSRALSIAGGVSAANEDLVEVK